MNNHNDTKAEYIKLLKNAPLSDTDLYRNLALFINRPLLSKLLYLDSLYKQIKDIHGHIIEFGVRWGQNLSVLQCLKGIYEPYNFRRKIIGFDTFAGFPTVHENDGSYEEVKVGEQGVSDNYQAFLEQILQLQVQNNPLPDMHKYELVVGDAVETLDKYLHENPETLVSLAYFDFDLYEPTKKCLELIKPRLCKGSIIAFDELNHEFWPGETQAFQEILGANNFTIKRFPHIPDESYIVFE